MVSLVVVVLEEGLDLLFKITAEKLVLQQCPVLQCLIPALDLALRLWMIRSAANVTHPVASEPVGELI